MTTTPFNRIRTMENSRDDSLSNGVTTTQKINDSTSDNEEVNEYSSFLKNELNKVKCNSVSIHIIPIRRALGLTQSELATKTGFTKSYINMIERGKLIPILETKIKIARALNTDTSAIWIKEEE